MKHTPPPPRTRKDMLVTQWGARFQGREFACAIGQGGSTTHKTEGDGQSPAGIWKIAHGLYRADRMARPRCQMPMRQISPFDIWSDDSNDPQYNHGYPAIRPRFGHEKLRRPDPLYDIILVTDWNWPDARPGRGSAIFVHAWRRPRFPTAGCLAFAAPDLRWILARWTRQSRIFMR